MRKKFVFILLVSSLFCFNAYAEGKSYKIELIVFAQKMPNTEVFDHTESQINWPGSIADRSEYKAVVSQYMSLQGIESKLSSTSNYKPLMHVAWIQYVGANRLSKAVRISNSTGTINGFFRIQRGNLVHMIVDIEYSPESIVYRLNEKRRFKLNEIHYLDHPKFGILAKVSPL